MEELDQMETDIQQIMAQFANVVQVIKNDEDADDARVVQLTRELLQKLEAFEGQVQGSDVFSMNVDALEKENVELEGKFQKVVHEKKELEDKLNAIKHLFENVQMK